MCIKIFYLSDFYYLIIIKMAKNPEGREQEQQPLKPLEKPHVKNEKLAKEEFDELNLTEEEKHVIRLLKDFCKHANNLDDSKSPIEEQIIKENFRRFPRLSKSLVKKMCDLMVNKENRYPEFIIPFITQLIYTYYDKLSDDSVKCFNKCKHEIYQIYPRSKEEIEYMESTYIDDEDMYGDDIDD